MTLKTVIDTVPQQIPRSPGFYYHSAPSSAVIPGPEVWEFYCRRSQWDCAPYLCILIVNSVLSLQQLLLIFPFIKHQNSKIHINIIYNMHIFQTASLCQHHCPCCPSLLLTSDVCVPKGRMYHFQFGGYSEESVQAFTLTFPFLCTKCPGAVAGIYAKHMIHFSP